ncbi:hypothetical protein ACQPW3_24480 [Actinosynnema sp. CA-248983]
MPNPITGNPDPAGARTAAVPQTGPVPRHAAVDGEMALRLPDWDLLPPAEFLDRRRGGR